MKRNWTLGEIEDLRIMIEVEGLSHREAAEALGRTKQSVCHKARIYKFKTSYFMDKRKKIELRNLVENSTIDKNTICKRLKITKRSLNYRMELMSKTCNLTNIRNKRLLKTNGAKWSQEEDDFIYKNYYKIGRLKTAKELGRTLGALKKRMFDNIDKKLLEKGFYTKGWNFKERTRIWKESRDL